MALTAFQGDFILRAPTPRVAPEAAEEASAASHEDRPGLRWPVVASENLLRGETCVHIEHAGALYVLRATRNGKLILTK
ncbi:hemin uptake protein HemP [Viridibacterium curvum]|uniref:Hemin uptake protein HemP n=1 Tax=Viridibacterium curvum TaxID=1101404 RepID=A0ABP9QFM8_9RHOO